MNYIHQLQSENDSLRAAIIRANAEIDLFIGFLHSEKFTGTAGDGSRKDWIATADVIARMMEIRNTISPQ